MSVALITGGSRGIGAATAKLAARRGFAVAVNYLARGDEANKVVRDIEGAGGRAIAVHADMASERDIVRMFETVDRELGALTALVNNAGITGGVRLIKDADAAHLEQMWRVNVTGCFLCCREAIRRMTGGNAERARTCSIINVSSKAAVLGGGGEWVHYAASKGAVDTLTTGLARELGGSGIRVNAVRPGLIATDIQAQGLPGRVEKGLSTIPLGRAGSVDEVAALIVWLMSAEASYVHGALIDVSGGR